MTNWEKFVEYMHITCGMQYDAEEEFVRCAECDEPVYKVDFNHDKPTCPHCTYNIETEDKEVKMTNWEKFVEYMDIILACNMTQRKNL